MLTGEKHAPALDHVLEAALYVNDVERAVEFYGGVLGLPMILHTAGEMAFFRCGQTIVLVFNPAVTEKQGKHGPGLPIPAHGTRGQGHVCFGVDGQALAAWAARLEEHNVPIEERITWPNGARSLYFRDPEGNCLEFAEPKLWETA